MVPKNVAGALEETGKDAPKSLLAIIRESTEELTKVLPSHLSPERLVRIALTSIRLNPKLSECTPESFMGALFTAAQVGLEPVAGRAYLLPFNNSKKLDGKWKTIKEVQFIIGYKGLVDLFYRHEAALSIDTHTVREKDQFDYEYGTNAFLRHIPAKRDRGEAIGYYAIGKTKGGGTVFLYMAKEDVITHAQKHSKTFDEKTCKFFDYSPWSTEFDAMAKKTVLIQLSKMLPLSVELQKAISVDETSREYRKGIGSAFDLPDNINWEKKPAELPGPEEKGKDETEPSGNLAKTVPEIIAKINKIIVDNKMDSGVVKTVAGNMTNGNSDWKKWTDTNALDTLCKEVEKMAKTK